MVNKSKQLSYWQGKFGDEYINRNRDLTLFKKRMGFFKKLLNSYPEIKSILEVGTNIGGNLSVLQQINPTLDLTAIEPNKKAAAMAEDLVPEAHIFNQSIQGFERAEKYDLVYTSGVLIHISDNDLKTVLQKIYDLSRKYILTIEYYSEKKQLIPYRNLTDALFKRPYNREWLVHYPRLKLLTTGFLDTEDGFDNCHWWLFEKFKDYAKNDLFTK